MKTVCKKLFSLLLVAVLLVSAIPFQAFAAESINVNFSIQGVSSKFPGYPRSVITGINLNLVLPNVQLVEREYKNYISDGKVFGGFYFTTGARSGEKVANGMTLSADMANGKDLGIEARFIYPEKTITLDAKGGSVSPTSIKVTKGDVYPELPTPTRSGYKFVGWFADENNQVGWGTEVKNYNNLFAKWELGTFNVTFQDWSESKQDFVDSSFIYNVANGKSLNEHKTQNGFTLPEPGSFTSRNGYSVSETTPWIDENGNAITFDAKLTRDIKIRPNYVGNEYTITYDFNCPELAKETQKVKFGSKVTLKQPTRTNYVFMGWHIVEANNKELKTGDTYNYGDTTLVAYWAEKGTVELRVYRDDTDGFKTYYYSNAVKDGELDLNNCKIQDYLKGTYEFDGWYDYNRWVDYLGTKDAKGVEVASNEITRLDSVKTTTQDSSVTIIYGMVKGYKTTNGNNATTGNNNNNNVNTGTPDPSNPKTGDTIMIAVTTMTMAAAALVAMYELKKRKMI